jgi:hypothetical protein
MLKILTRSLLGFALSLPILSPAMAAEDDGKLVESVPPEIAEIVTGGGWSEGKQGGFYRAFVLMTGEEEKFGAKIYLQWLTVSEANPDPAILKTVPVTELNNRNLENAAIDIEGEQTKENEMAFIVSSYDFEKKKDILLLVTATQPGKYTVKETKAPGAPAAGGGAPGGQQ